MDLYDSNSGHRERSPRPPRANCSGVRAGKGGGGNKIIHPVPQGLRSGFGEPFMKGITECSGGSGARSGARRRPLLPVASRRRCRRHLGAAPQLCPTTAWGGAEEGKSAGGGR